VLNDRALLSGVYLVQGGPIVAQVKGKTVFVLGAGASVHTGAPLLRGFMPLARTFLESEPEERLIWKSSFQNIFKWVDSQRGSAYYVDIDFDNLEHLFSLLALQKEIGDKQAESLYLDLSHVVVSTLALACQTDYAKGRFSPDQVYRDFVSTIASEPAGQAWHLRAEWLPAVITLIY
jgi:hypothetical protein